MTLLEASKLALEALDTASVSVPDYSSLGKMFREAATALRTAIEEAEKVEPVAWIHPLDLGRFGSVTFNRDSFEQIPLYTHPAPAVSEGEE